MNNSSEKGQMLLIVVLIMVVALTVGLSIAARSLVNLKIATDDENSQRAFSAAEAGIERLIKTDCSGQCNLDEEQLGNGASFTGQATAIEGVSFLIKDGIEIKQDEGTDIWLSTYSSDPALIYGNSRSGTVNLFWGDSSNDCSVPARVPAALDIIIFSKPAGTIIMNRKVVDPCSRGNNFSSTNIAGESIGPRSFPYGYSFDVVSALLVRVVPIYSNAIMGVRGSANLAFPTQGKQIEASGEAGGTVRKVTYVQSYASIPNEFVQYSLISR
jgi:hypothetical protein